MTAKAYSLSNYRFSKGELVLLDANILLYLFPGPLKPSHVLAKTYSHGINKLVQAEAIALTNTLLISEYLNSYCRLEYNATFAGTYDSYKKFRNSRDFPKLAQNASQNAKEILQLCQIHDFQEKRLNITGILSDFKAGKLDFNDAVYVDICRTEKFKFMTNDADFKNCGINILSCNQRLLK